MGRGAVEGGAIEADDQLTDYRYAAFISYRHVEPDRKWARWLQRGLETYRVPKAMRRARELPARIGRVFRDEDELSASSDLSQEIEAALRQSRNLVVVCSPRTPVSAWVNQEVVRFQEMGRGDRVLALLIEGEPSESFPASLRKIRRDVLEEHGKSREETEPLAADVRPSIHELGGHARRMAMLRLVSRVLGCRFDDLRRREQQRQRRRVVAAGALLLSLIVLLTGLSVFAFRQQARAERERNEKAQALAEKSRALAAVFRLSDAKRIRDLEDAAAALTAATPGLDRKTTAWLARAGEIITRLPGHAAALETLRARALAPGPAWRFPSPELEWQHEILADLVDRLDRLAAADDPVHARIERLRSHAMRLREASEQHAVAWAETIEQVSASDRYDALSLVPQGGLIPLGSDPDSGLFEFGHVGSGALPTRDPATKSLTLTADSAVVFVLVPGGTTAVGAQKVDPDSCNYDPSAYDWEAPVRRVTVSPFFLAKHECTQAQWKALSWGRTPSYYEGDRHPVEQVAWEDSVVVLGEHGLVLPSEAQWEYACRAGTDTSWWTGPDVERLRVAAWYRDTPGSGTHPVGEKAANAFGLHDIHGNVWEWCEDTWRKSNQWHHEGAPVDGSAFDGGDPDTRVIRGGSCFSSAEFMRSAFRRGIAVTTRDFDLGVRPTRAITHDNETARPERAE